MRFRVSVGLLIAALTAVWPSPAAAADAAEFPVGYEGYHTYAEMNAFLDDVVGEFGQGSNAIVTRRVIGHSYEGRPIVALKISDKAAKDQAEPEVLSVSMVHAREHITLEMNLYMIRLLTENYGKSTALGQRVTDIVNSREIWVIPMANPDGAIYNISDGEFHGWRKNRQPNPGTDKLGTDLNRNFGFGWNCCGGSSGNPKSARYRGAEPWSAPETRVLRDFVLSRVSGGQQQIKAIFNWHSYGEFVTWPYGYTREDVPPTMSADDHDVFVSIGQHMASLNGYRGKQGSDSYVYDGDMLAWMYGDQRIIGFTFEMFPRWGAKAGGFKPDDAVLERETTRNRESVLYFMEQADCPYRAAGLGATHCGPLNDDFETGRGWTFGGTTEGRWQRGIPSDTSTGAGAKQRATTPSGQAALVTGTAAGADVNANDVDGLTWARSPLFTVGQGHKVRFSYTFAHDAGSSSADFLRLKVVRGTSVTTIWSTEGSPSERNAAWQTVDVSLAAFGGANIRLLFESSDGEADDVVEAALDDVRVFKAP